MGYVKLDSGILDSSLWMNPDQTRVFITAMVMAMPREVLKPMPQFQVRQLEHTGFVVPPGWYGFVEAAGPGIAHRAKLDAEAGLVALEALGEPDAASRNSAFDGRRLARVEGGFVVLNFMDFRDKDHTGKERAQRYRERKKGGPANLPDSEKRHGASRVSVTPSRVTVTQSESESIETSQPLVSMQQKQKQPGPPGSGLRPDTPTPVNSGSRPHLQKDAGGVASSLRDDARPRHQVSKSPQEKAASKDWRAMKPGNGARFAATQAGELSAYLDLKSARGAEAARAKSNGRKSP